jgi:hypothetical protein
MVTVAKTDALYPAQVIEAASKALGKPALAQEAIALADQRGAGGVPDLLRAAIEAAVTLARSAA